MTKTADRSTLFGEPGATPQPPPARVRANQVTATRTKRRRDQEPLGLTDAILHLRDRAKLMRSKPLPTRLRWNWADIEAVEALLAVIAAKTRQG